MLPAMIVPCTVVALIAGVLLAFVLKNLPKPRPPGAPSEEDARAPQLALQEDPARRALLDGFAGSQELKEAFFRRFDLTRPKLLRAVDTLQIFKARLRGKLFRMPVLVGFFRQRKPVSPEQMQMFWEEIETSSHIVAGIVISLGPLAAEARDLVRVRRLYAIDGDRLVELLAPEVEEEAEETPVVRAAGVVVVRRGMEEEEVLLLRNPRHDTWGFPKGHLDPGEDDLEGALRELQEEIGWAPTEVEPGFRVESVYTLPDTMGGLSGRTKKVVYFLAWAPPTLRVRLSEEHAEFVWESYTEAREKLRFSSAQTVIDALVAFVETPDLEPPGGSDAARPL